MSFAYELGRAAIIKQATQGAGKKPAPKPVKPVKPKNTGGFASLKGRLGRAGVGDLNDPNVLLSGR